MRLAFWVAVMMPGCAIAANHATLSNSDIRIQVEAGSSSPRLVSVKGATGLELVNETSEALPASVDVDGASAPVIVQWKFAERLTVADKDRVEFVYESANPHLKLHWIWEARAAFGPLEHSISVENLGAKEIWLPMIDSLSLEVKATDGLTHFYVEKGADSPSAEGTHLAGLSDGYSWTGYSSTYAHPTPGQGRELIPIETIFSSSGKQPGWFAGIEFSGRTRVELDRHGDALHTVLGLNPEPGPFRTRLVPGGNFTTPAVFLGAFEGGVDGAGNQLRPWVRAVLNNPETWKDPQYPVMVNNSWGSGMSVDDALARRMLADSKELGLEMLGIDAGWFRGVGDWYPNPVKFPNGIAPIADEAHRLGLRIGMWVDWTQAALDTQPGALNVRDPKVRDWMVTDLGPEWKPEDFKGQTIDIGVPAAHAYAKGEVKRIVESDHLDMLEHDGYVVAQGCIREDHPHAPPNRSTMKVTHDWGSDFVLADNSTDVSYHAVRAYYDIQDSLRKVRPGILLEVCNDGGRMVDFGSASHADYFSITDTYDPLSNRRAFYDTSFVLPAAMLESYVEKWPTPAIDQFRYMLRSGMMGWLTVMLDTTKWSPEQHDSARQAFALYKRRLRPLIRDAQLYHVSPRPDGVHWDGVEYWDPGKKSGVVYAFRGSVADEPAHAFQLKGVDPSRRYKLHFEDGSSPDTEAAGTQLMADGISVQLSKPLSSELIFFEEAQR